MRISRAAALTVSLTVVVAVAILIWILGFATRPPELEPPMFSLSEGAIVVRAGSPLDRRLHVVPVPIRVLPHKVTLPAEIIAEPRRTITVLSPASGRIIDVAVQLGQKVKQGQLLATIAAGDLAQAWADDRRARAALDLARRAYTRAKSVLEIGGNAVKDLQSARNDLAQAQAEADRTKQRLQSLGAPSTYMTKGLITLTSPVNGVVSALSMAPGQNITDTTAAQMTLLDLGEVWVAAALPENRLDQLAPGSVLSAPFSGRLCQGPVTAASPALNPETRRMTVYLACANPDGALHPGLYTTADLLVPEERQILLPKTALLMNGDAVSVFIETAPHTFRRRFVQISYDEGDFVRVLSGVSEGERVVDSGGILLNDD